MHEMSDSVDSWCLTVGQLAAQVMDWRTAPALAVHSMGLLRKTLTDDAELLCLAIETSLKGRA